MLLELYVILDFLSYILDCFYLATIGGVHLLSRTQGARSSLPLAGGSPVPRLLHHGLGEQ
jgi:hypothetical protein